ncbi:MAG: hypothetical protein NWF00_12335 [Candidatus Bathyarchaeota archaeon]|nr:hypothetical protein [Candidatus Bathyarchaeota archaeon]
MNPKRATPALVLIAIFAVSIFLTFDPINTGGVSDFYVGVEFAYSPDINDAEINLNTLKTLVDEVKDYTNLFVIGIPEVSQNQEVLNESCNYIYDAGLHMIILFTDTTSYNYTLNDWTSAARQKYGEKFLGVYRLDEPGGKELDNYEERTLNKTVPYLPNVRNYTGASDEYVQNLQVHIEHWNHNLYSTLLTADYGLYWFDYKAGYNTILAEFGWNHSRQITVGLCRGAATAYNREWGAIITWTYDQEPYIASGPEIYEDMVLAYQAGAKHVVVFSYPDLNKFGILTEEHFEAMKEFWQYINKHPEDHGSQQATVAYVLPQDYGFGFRRANDTIRGLWTADDLVPKIWEDVNKLSVTHGLGFDIVYNDPEFHEFILAGYEKVIFWNETLPHEQFF